MARLYGATHTQRARGSGYKFKQGKLHLNAGSLKFHLKTNKQTNKQKAHTAETLIDSLSGQRLDLVA